MSSHSSSPSSSPYPHATVPRFEVNWIERQIGLGIAITRKRQATFRFELLLIVGPIAFVCGIWRTGR